MDKEKPLILTFPKLNTIDLADPEIQAELIKWGVAIGVPGVHIEFVKAVELTAGGE